MGDNQEILKILIGKLSDKFGLDSKHIELEQNSYLEMVNAITDLHPELVSLFECEEIGNSYLSLFVYLKIKESYENTFS